MKRERKKAPNRLPTQFNSVQPQPQLKCASNNSINIQLNEANESGETIINDNSSQFWLNSHVDRQRVHIEFIKMVETVRLWALTHTGNEQWDEVRARARARSYTHTLHIPQSTYSTHIYALACATKFMQFILSTYGIRLKCLSHLLYDAQSLQLSCCRNRFGRESESEREKKLHAVWKPVWLCCYTQSAIHLIAVCYFIYFNLFHIASHRIASFWCRF